MAVAESREVLLARYDKRLEWWEPEQVLALDGGNYRKTFDPEQTEELMNGIASAGQILMPLWVAEKKTGGIERIAGGRRCLAFRQLYLQGWRPVDLTPVWVFLGMDELAIADLQTVENCHVPPPAHELAEHLGESFARHRRIDPHYSYAELARLVARSPSTVSRAWRWYRLPEEIKGLVRAEKLSYGAALEFERLLEEFGREQVLDRIRTALVCEKSTVAAVKSSIERELKERELRRDWLSLDGPVEEAKHRAKVREFYLDTQLSKGAHSFLGYFTRVIWLARFGYIQGKELPFRNRAVVGTFLRAIGALEETLPALRRALSTEDQQRSIRVLHEARELFAELDGQVEGSRAKVVAFPMGHEESTGAHPDQTALAAD